MTVANMTFPAHVGALVPIPRITGSTSFDGDFLEVYNKFMSFVTHFIDKFLNICRGSLVPQKRQLMFNAYAL